jgi:hypothetical protein
MDFTLFVDNLAIQTLFLALVLSFFIFLESGFRIGLFFQTKTKSEISAPVGPVMAAVLGLLGFIMALTFSTANNRFLDRTYLVVEEANVIEIAYLRTDSLKENTSIQAKELIREYATVRLKGGQNTDSLSEVISRSEEIHKELWRLANGEDLSEGESKKQFMISVIDIVSIHNKRVGWAVYQRINSTIWLTLIIIASLTMLVMGYHAGLAGTRNLIATSTVIITFAIVILIIVDLDRLKPQLFDVPQTSMLRLVDKLSP